jgi:hypothetical protein
MQRSKLVYSVDQPKPAQYTLLKRLKNKRSRQDQSYAETHLFLHQFLYPENSRIRRRDLIQNSVNIWDEIFYLNHAWSNLLSNRTRFYQAQIPFLS